MENISMHDLSKKLGKLESGEVILDVRTPEEFAEGHIPGAINISHEEVAQHIAQLKKYKKIYMHCRSGGRVRMAMSTLQNSGLNIVCITNSGMMDWIQAGYPTER